MRKTELTNGMPVRVKMDHGWVADIITDVGQVYGVWTERCHLVDERQIYPATEKSTEEISEYMRGGMEMLVAGDVLMAALIEPEFI